MGTFFSSPNLLSAMAECGRWSQLTTSVAKDLTIKILKRNESYQYGISRAWGLVVFPLALGELRELSSTKGAKNEESSKVPGCGAN